MSIDRILARFSIQTKVLVFVVPLIGGIAGLTAINLYTGSLFTDRLSSALASIDTLQGFKQAYAGMNEFLTDTTEENRDAVIEQLERQVARLDEVAALATTPEEAEPIERASAIAAALRARIGSLWDLNTQGGELRGRFTVAIDAMSQTRVRVQDAIGSLQSDLESAEGAARKLLANADRLTRGADALTVISSGLNMAANPEDAFKFAGENKEDMKRLSTELPAAIPDDKPALKSLISDNLNSLVTIAEKGVVSEAGLQDLQRYANTIRPAGLQLNSLAFQAAREATVRYAELEKPIARTGALVAHAQNLSARIFSLELAATRFVATPDEALKQQLDLAIVQIEQGMQRILLAKDNEKLMEAIGPDTLTTVRSLPDLATALIENNGTRQAALNEAADAINEGWAGVTAFAASHKVGAETVKERASGITLAAALLTGIFGMLATLLLVGALKGPILRLVRSMADVADGRLDIEIAGDGRGDEIGQMARALAVFRRNAIDKVRIEEESERERSVAASEQARRDSEKAAHAAEIDAAVHALGAALRNLADGDLVSVIDTPFEGELDRLRLDFNESVGRIRDAMGRIRENAEAIRNNSSQLRSAADDLSRRTEQQAASLEETAAAVDQISATVRQSSERAADTDNLASETCDDARRSGEVVSRAVEAMGRIEQASGRIGQIIGVIDEIAFQTNLLALNAGVEAARAGEAGRGFAVVAQEVRELAGRSAAAAREIKALISESGNEVNAGVSLVGETGQAISRIIERIEEISAHVAAMATASREQASGLGEVNSAVNEMDRMTQQNAAMVEETNAASHTLAQEASELSSLVSAFRLDETGSGAVYRAA